jgi:hypothetical protein
MTKDATGTVIENRAVMITSQWLSGSKVVFLAVLVDVADSLEVSRSMLHTTGRSEWAK